MLALAVVIPGLIRRRLIMTIAVAMRLMKWLSTGMLLLLTLWVLWKRLQQVKLQHLLKSLFTREVLLL